MTLFPTWLDALKFVGMMVAFGLFAGEVAAFMDSRVNRALGRTTRVERDAWRVWLGTGAFLLAVAVVAVVGWGR